MGVYRLVKTYPTTPKKSVLYQQPPNILPILLAQCPRTGSAHETEGTSQGATSGPLCDEYEDLGTIPGHHWEIFTIFPQWFPGDPIYMVYTLGRSSITSSGEPSRRINKYFAPQRYRSLGINDSFGPTRTRVRNPIVSTNLGR